MSTTSRPSRASKSGVVAVIPGRAGQARYWRVRHAKRPAENFPIGVSRLDRIPPPKGRGRFANRAIAGKGRALPFFGRCDANRMPARTSKAETPLLFRATHPRLLLRVHSEARNRLAS